MIRRGDVHGNIKRSCHVLLVLWENVERLLICYAVVSVGTRWRSDWEGVCSWEHKS